VGEHGFGGGWAREAGWKETAAAERASSGVARPVARSRVSNGSLILCSVMISRNQTTI
jgi:hypothetical protein